MIHVYKHYLHIPTLLSVDQKIYVETHRKSHFVQRIATDREIPTMANAKVFTPLTSSCQIHRRLLADACIGPRDNHRLPVQASCTVAPTSPHPSPVYNDRYPCNSMQNTNSIHYGTCIRHVVVNAV